MVLNEIKPWATPNFVDTTNMNYLLKTTTKKTNLLAFDTEEL